MIRMILDSASILITLAGMLVLYVQEYYAVTTLLFLIFLISCVLLIKHSIQRPYKYHSLTHEIEFSDENNENALWTQTAIFTPLEKNITTWNSDRLFRGPGKLTPLNTNIGKIMTPIDEGGTLLVPTLFSCPLEVGKKITKILTIECSGVFPEDTENFSWIPINYYKQLIFKFKYSENKPALSAECYVYGRNTAKKLDSLFRSPDGRTVTLEIEKPKLGSRYVVSWSW